MFNMIPFILDRQKIQGGGISLSFKQQKVLLRLIRFLLLELPLVLTFTGVMIMQGIAIVHEQYYVPLMDRATRTDDDLREEMTYYHRTCTVADITTQDAANVLANVEAPVSQGVDKIMTHGALVIPHILKPETVQKLRDYAVYRNRVIPEHEQFPVSQGQRRISFGYDATEHPALIQAVREITQHKYLQQLLPALLGDHDPASTEITTITQYYGASEMYWHPDTKPDGNAVKYARTYSHSFSLFVSLQNTTKEMGATEFCLGSHYCGDDELVELCRQHAVGLHAATPEQVFRSGDGAMFNQHVWHAAPPHIDPHAPERIMFIMSFLARPKPQLDQRQLSRGTYFHQKWNMWGHTWRDLMDPTRYMQKPYSYLKCLGLWTWTWTWSGRSCGYDLVTATIMRFANNQLGSDLTRFVHIWDDILKWPAWLHGPNYEYEVEQKEAWQMFIQETIAILSRFVQRVASAVHGLYFLVALGFSIWASSRQCPKSQSDGGKRVFRSLKALLKQFVWTHGFVAALLVFWLEGVKTSEWGQGIRNGQVLKRPFPSFVMPREEEERLEKRTRSLTTLPMAKDVLLGTRFDAPWLGAYEQWLDWHPGNRNFLQALREHSPWYAYYKNCPALQDQIMQEVRRNVTQHGARVLRQDFRTGDWRILSAGLDQDETLQKELVFASTPLLQDVDRVFKRMIAFYRFTSLNRESTLARKSVVSLTLFQQRLIKSIVASELATGAPNPNRNVGPLNEPRSLRKQRSTPPSAKVNAATETFRSRKFNIQASVRKDNQDRFPAGYPVLFESYDPIDGWLWYKGDVVSRHNGQDGDEYYKIGLDAEGVVSFVDPKQMRRYEPIVEGDFVKVCFEAGLEDCYDAQVLLVMADGTISAMLTEPVDEEEEEEGVYTFLKDEYYKPLRRQVDQ